MVVAPVKKREGNTALREAAGREWGRNNKEGKREVLKFLCWFKCLTTNSEYRHRPECFIQNQSGLIYKQERATTAEWFTATTVSSWIWAQEQGDSGLPARLLHRSGHTTVLLCHSAEQTEQIRRKNVLKTQSVFLLRNSLNVESKHFRSTSRISALMSRAIISIFLLES